MTAYSTPRIDDGTTGGSGPNGRRTHIIQVLRDVKEPLSVTQVAEAVDIHPNTARFHLESLVNAGLATKETEVSSQPGRHRTLYSGTLPNQTHERAQGYRLLAQILTGFIAAKHPDEGEDMYDVGRRWGSYLTSQPAPFEVLDEDKIEQRIMNKLDALWFAPEFCDTPQPHLLLHNCPFIELAQNAPDIVCRLHIGMVNGSLAELRSTRRVVELCPLVAPHLCEAWLGPATAISHEAVTLTVSIPEGTEGSKVSPIVAV